MSLTRPLTRPLTRALSQSELTQKLGGGFSIFALNPYLLFDARDSMVGTLENPTLDLNPALPETLDVITATRAGTATYTDVNGNIASASPNTVRVDQTQGAELTPTKFQLVTNTEFNTVWSKYVFGGASLDVTSGYVSPTGDNDAFKFDLDVGTGGVLFTQNATINPLNAQTLSVYMKGENGGEKVKLALRNTSSTGASGDIITLTSEWERYTVTLTTSSANRGFQFRLTTSEGVSDQVFYVYGPQLEEGTTASSFVANTTGSPKFITGATFGPRVPMILVEPSSENLLPYSEDISNSAWSKFGAGTGVVPTVTPDFGTSPDGTLSASRVQFNKGSGTSVGDQSVIFDSVQTSSGATTSKSVYLKSNTTEAYEMVIYEVTDASGTNVKKITVTPDWQRFHVYGAIASTTTGISIGLREISVSGLSNTADVLVWGAQVEAGSLTSYIPTSGSTVTRAADDLVISGSDFDFYNTSEGTFYVEAVPRITTNERYFTVTDGSTQNRVMIYQNGTYSNFYVNNSGSVQATLGNPAISLNNINRVSASYKLNDFKTSADGSSENTDTNATPPTSVDRLNIGSSALLGNQLNGHIKRLIYWPYHSDSL